jgi:hypothetical protein
MLQQVDKDVELCGFIKEKIRTRIETSLSVLEIRIVCKYDHFGRFLSLLESLQGGDAISTWYPDVKDDHIRSQPFDSFQSCYRISSLPDNINPFDFRNHLGQTVTKNYGVIYDEYLHDASSSLGKTAVS